MAIASRDRFLAVPPRKATSARANRRVMRRRWMRGLSALSFVGGASFLLSVLLFAPIHEDAALQQFKEMAGTTDVVVVSMTNHEIFTGYTDVVRYVIEVNGAIQTEECDKGGLRSESMVCWVKPIPVTWPVSGDDR